MKKDLLTLLGCSSSIALTLMTVSPASANSVPIKEYVFTSANEGTEVLAVEQPTENLIADVDLSNCGCNAPDLSVTDAEGDLAIANYGCDCAGCRFLVQNMVNEQNL
jgi:hypothetical protein